MRTPANLQTQLATMREDRLRVLIVGAGVAGLTLASALRRRGLHPVLIERAGPGTEQGYMLALMPLVDPVIASIGVRDAYLARSQALRRYRVRGRHGEVIRDYSMAALLAAFGDYRGIARGELLDVLSPGGLPVTFATTVTAIEQSPAAARATLASGDPGDATTAEFDAIIVADGLHSTTRGLVLRPDQVETFDSGWGGWIAWTESEPDTADLGEDIWGARFFLGMYPVLGQDGVIVGGDRRDTAAGPARFVAAIRDELPNRTPRVNRALDAVAADDDPYFWTLTDCRSATWAIGRVGLLGDAAAGFLPTAGIGAAMAMESAGQLARHLGDESRDEVPAALQRFERTQRPRVLAAQDNSRQLARLMFQRHELVAAVRDTATRLLPLSLVLGPIRKLHTEAPAA